jgi:hypothetical protein
MFSNSVNIISVWCYSDPPHQPWILSCIYGPPYHNDKALFWESMCSIGNLYDGPWLCIGDFNMILNQSDKKGGRPFACSSNDPFQSFVHSQGLVDLGFSGNPYTWSNNRDGIHLIQERLDRGLASAQWIHLFPSFSLCHQPSHTSDHHSLLLNTAPQTSTLPRPFRFEEFWVKDPTCRTTISLAWNTFFNGSPGFILSNKLKRTKHALKLWNIHHFGHIQKKIGDISSL